MNEIQRVTQLDVARKAGVHRTTVSLALKKHPGIPEATRKRILEIAKEIGYRPDPMLSALAAYRSSKQVRQFQGTLAWLVSHDPPGGWRQASTFLQYYEGAKRKAESLGYQLTVFELHGPEMNSARVARVLRAQNIKGILLCPQPKAHAQVDFPWKDFSAVTFGYSLEKPALHRVTATQYRATIQLMQKLYGMGYQRVGFVYPFSLEERVEHACLSGYLSQVYLHDGAIRIPPLLESPLTIKAFLNWFQEYRPDTVVVGPGVMETIIQKSGLKVPKDLAVANPVLARQDSKLAGIYENSVRIGEVAVEFLVNMLLRGERGVPETPEILLVEGKWNPGRTLKTGRAGLKR